MKNWRFSTDISIYFENGIRKAIVTMEDHAVTADSFAVSCIAGWVGLGWVHCLSNVYRQNINLGLYMCVMSLCRRCDCVVQCGLCTTQPIIS